MSSFRPAIDLRREPAERAWRARIGGKLLLISAIYLFILIGLIVLGRFSVGFLSDVRAYVGGEGLWSKGQKDAVYSLVKYTTLGREEDYEAFRRYMEVPLGDRRARLALSQPRPDYAAAEKGFLAGGNHPDDVAGLARLFIRFGWYPKMRRAITIWTEADTELDELIALAEAIRADGEAGRLRGDLQTRRLAEIDAVNVRLTQLENDFSLTLGSAARQTTTLVSLAALALAGLAIAGGVLLTNRISRQIVAAITTLREGARRIGRGDFLSTIEVSTDDELGELASAFNSMSDALVAHIDALEKAHAALAEMDRLKTQFFANVSHELRTPLSLILGPTTKMLESDSLPDALRRDAKVIQQNARLLLKHVNDLLDLSRLDAGSMEAVFSVDDLAAMVRRVASHFEVLAADRSIRLRCATPDELRAELDSDKIERVLFNLLSNAFKFTPDGGEVELTLADRGENAILAVSDSGPGVPPALRHAVFERFRQGDGDATRRQGGTGLGLAIAHEFVEQHHGRIELGDASLGGARFEVTLPLRAPAGVEVRAASRPKSELDDRAETYLAELAPIDRDGLAAPSGETPSAQPGRRARVLVVEDNLEMRRFLAEGLADTFEVETAPDGRAGLAAARSSPPDLILSDIMMPEMSGDQLLAELQLDEQLAALPFVVLSAKADEDLRVEMLRAGARDFLVKPFRLSELRARLRRLVEIKREREELEQSERASRHRAGELGENLRERNRQLADTIAQLTASDRDLREALADKEVLLQEIHHRVKNNLQIVASLVHLQESSIDDPMTRAQLQHCRDRVRTMALLHEMLHRGTRRGRVNLAEYVERLASHVLRWHGDPSRLRIETDIESVTLDLDLAVHCGLVVHELVANAVEHAFPDQTNGTITIRGRADGSGGRLELEITDDGVGVDADELRRGEHLGLKLAQRLAGQIGGRLVLGEPPGTRWRLTFEAPQTARPLRNVDVSGEET